MEKVIVFETSSLYRDTFRVTGYRFGSGEKSVCMVGNTCGNEVQQIYVCGKMVKLCKLLEKQGMIAPGKELLVIPSMNPYSVNCHKRFWPTDNTDINRMFPGYDQGETTQRIAAGVFAQAQQYRYGIQLASFYMPGRFMPHIRMMETGFQDVDMAKAFGMPYVVLRKVRPYETTTLNYNWQIWETKAFSVFTGTTSELDEVSAMEAVRGIVRFLIRQEVLAEGAMDLVSGVCGLLQYKMQDNLHEKIEMTEKHANYAEIPGGCGKDCRDYPVCEDPKVVSDLDLVPVRAMKAGLYQSLVQIGEQVQKGQLLARIIHPLEGEVIEELRAPQDGVIFFDHTEPLVYARTAVLKLV